MLMLSPNKVIIDGFSSVMILPRRFL